MTIIRKPSPGQKAGFERDSKIWSQIIDVVNAYHAGRLTSSPASSSKPLSIKCKANRVMSRGEIAATKNEGSDVSSGGKHIRIDLEDVEWHDNIANIVIVDSPAAVIGQQVSIATSTWNVVKLSERVHDNDVSEYRYVMPDSDDPKKLKAAASGIYEVVCFLDNNNKAVVDTTKSQPYWRYELTGSWDSDKEAKAKLFDINDNEFTGSKRATITDIYEFMEDQGSGDKGICLHTGNKFHAIQAICS